MRYFVVFFSWFLFHQVIRKMKTKTNTEAGHFLSSQRGAKRTNKWVDGSNIYDGSGDETSIGLRNVRTIKVRGVRAKPKVFQGPS